MIDFVFEYYTDGMLLTFAFGIFVYILNTQNVKKEMKFFQFIISNLIVSSIWFITIPLTIILSFKDAVKKIKE